MTDNSDRCLRVLEFENGVNTVAWSPDGTRLAIGDNSGGVEVLTAEGRRLWQNSDIGRSAIRVDWSFDSSYVIAAHNDITIAVHEAATGREHLYCDQYSYTLACSPRENVFATKPKGIREGLLKIIRIRTGEELSSWSGHRGPVWSASWSPDGQRIASGSDDRSVRIWNIRTGRSLIHIEGHSNKVVSVTWSPDGQRLASGSHDQTVRIWDLETGRCLIKCKKKSGANRVAWSPGGNLLASTSSDGSVLLWDPDTGNQLHNLEGHTETSKFVAFSPDATRLASASSDMTVRIWAFPT